jgi:plasmid stabilization system protein ParE
MASYFVTVAAQGDIEDIVATVADNNAEAAEVLEERIYEAFELLAQMPGVGHHREDLTSLPVLFFPIKKTPYMAIYKDDSPTTIVRVVHGRRDIPSLLRDESSV